MKQERHFVVDILFVLALFAVFTVSALVLVTIGADVYQHTVQDMSQNYDSRTAMAYITEKIRRSDCLLENGQPAAELGTLENQPALMLTDDINGEYYTTYLYLYDGWLKELYIRQDSYPGENVAEAGQNIMKLRTLEYRQISDNLLSVSMTTPDGETKQLYLSLHCQ